MAANVLRNLEAFGMDVTFKTNPAHNLIKRRYIDLNSQQMVLREDIEKGLLVLYQMDLTEDYDAVIISDYDKGYVSPDIVQAIKVRYNSGKSRKIPIFVDSKRTDLRMYEKCVIKINNHEYSKAILPKDTKKLVVTRGADGAMYDQRTFPAPAVDVFDVTGAGDVFFAALCYFYLTMGMEGAIVRAIKLASISVQHHGTYTLTKEDILEVL